MQPENHADRHATSRGAVPAYMDVLRSFVDDAGTQWSAGTFGAIAEFLRSPDEPAAMKLDGSCLSAATDRGAVALRDAAGARLIAYETISSDAKSWRHSVALCLPEADCGMGRRSAVTELGPDRAAVRPSDQDAILFDLGLALLQTDACIRTADAGLIAAMRASEGKRLFDRDNPVLMDILRAGPHRVFVTRLARVEVFQPIPPPNGKSPVGPHTHILPKLLRANRTHAATVPMPSGWVPCANVYPPHPLLDAEGMPRPFDRARFEAFNALLARYGDHNLVGLQRVVTERVRSGSSPDGFAAPTSKFARTAVRIALRKLKASGEPAPSLESWLGRFDRAVEDDGDEEAQHAC